MTRDIDWFAAAQRAFDRDEARYQAELEAIDEEGVEADRRMGRRRWEP